MIKIHKEIKFNIFHTDLSLHKNVETFSHVKFRKSKKENFSLKYGFGKPFTINNLTMIAMIRGLTRQALSINLYVYYTVISNSYMLQLSITTQ